MFDKIFLASSNKNKRAEILRIFGEQKIELLTPAQLGLELDVEENGATFEQNALIKARAAHKLTGLPSISDDSGLCVDALDGRPGIFSSRYADGDEARIKKLLGELDGVPSDSRGAGFVCAIAFVYDGGEFCVRGECRGFIAEQPCGQHGFGYDPVFICPEYGKTFAQLDSAVKNRISHRAHALQAFEALLAQINI